MFASAAHDVRVSIFQQAYAPVPMETRGLVAEWSASAEDLTIWAATQSPHEVRAVASRILGLAEHRIRVIMRDTGGGFGQKVVPGREDLAIVLAARYLLPVVWEDGLLYGLMASFAAAVLVLVWWLAASRAPCRLESWSAFVLAHLLT